MMLEKQVLDKSSPSKETVQSCLTVPSLVREFKIRNYHYSILCLGGVSNEIQIEQSLQKITCNCNIPNFIEIDRFEINGQLYIILETESVEAKQDCEIPKLLTERELQIATLVAFGKVNKQIAAQLHISEWTVATYLRRIFAKLSVDSRAAMVYRCASLIRSFQALESSTIQS